MAKSCTGHMPSIADRDEAKLTCNVWREATLGEGSTTARTDAPFHPSLAVTRPLYSRERVWW
jgi:hypothetical protein